MNYGNIDEVSRYIKGWAFNSDKPTERVAIDLYVNGSLLLTFGVGNDARPDVAEHCQIDNASCGFFFDIDGLGIPPNSKLEFKFNSTGELVGGENPSFTKAKFSKIDIFEGEDGYWFYSGDRNSVIEQMTGARLPDPNIIDLWANRICLTRQAVINAGGKYIFVVVPDEIAVNPSLYSKDVSLSEGRSVFRLASVLDSLYGLQIMYPLEEIRSSWDTLPALVRTDSHLSWRAHSMISDLILSRLGLEPIPQPRWVSKTIVHDLAVYNGTYETEAEDIPSFEVAPDSGKQELQTRGTTTRVHVNPNGCIPLIFTCGHSSCKMYSTLVKEAAQITAVFDDDRVPIDLVKDLRPSLVVQYISERNLYSTSSEIYSASSVIERNLIARAIEFVNRTKSHLLTAEKKHETKMELDSGAEALRVNEEIAAERLST